MSAHAYSCTCKVCECAHEALAKVYGSSELNGSGGAFVEVVSKAEGICFAGFAIHVAADDSATSNLVDVVIDELEGSSPTGLRLPEGCLIPIPFRRLRMRSASTSALTVTVIGYRKLPPTHDAVGVARLINPTGAPAGFAGTILQVNPLLSSRTTIPAASADTSVERAIGTLLNFFVVNPYNIPEQSVRGVASGAGAVTSNIIAAPGAGLRNYITSIQVSVSAALGGTVTFNNGAGGATAFAIELASAATALVGDNIAAVFPVPLRLDANAALEVTWPVGTTARANAQGHIGR